MNKLNSRDTIFIENYKGYNLYKTNTKFPEDKDVITWSDNGGWLSCVFDSVETAKYFIDRRKLFTDNFYNVIVECQSKSIILNHGIVSVDIINQFEILK